MTTVLALLLVGVGSVGYRLLPLLGAGRLPETFSRVAGWAGLSVLAAVTVRGVLRHQDASVPWPVPVALVSVVLALGLAARGRPMLVVLGAGAATYVVLSMLVAAVA
jgi:branched-subunit amino acid transport protein